MVRIFPSVCLVVTRGYSGYDPSTVYSVSIYSMPVAARLLLNVVVRYVHMAFCKWSRRIEHMPAFLTHIQMSKT